MDQPDQQQRRERYRRIPWREKSLHNSEKQTRIGNYTAMAENQAFRSKVKHKLLLKSLSISRSGKWNFNHIPVMSRAPG